MAAWHQMQMMQSLKFSTTVALLHKKFPDRVISRCIDQECSAGSCDLTPSNLFLWGFILGSPNGS